MTYYFDTSALVKLIIREDETDAMRTFMSEQPPEVRAVSSALVEVELIRVTTERAPRRANDARQLLEHFVMVSLNLNVLRSASLLLPGSGVRTLDAIHLASAMQIPDLDAIVTYDKRMQKAAAMVGIKVLAPQPD